MQKNEIVSSEESDINDKRKEKLRKLFEYEETRENGKIVLLNKKLKLVQLTDCKEDREIYKTVTADYIDFLRNHRGLKIREDIDYEELFKREVLHEEHDECPLFAIYNKRNVLLGTCGSRGVLSVKNGDKNIIVHEASDRLISNHKGFGIGAVVIMLYHYLFYIKKRNFFVTTYADTRDFCMKVNNITNLCYFIGSKNRTVDEDIFGCIGKQDFYCTLYFEGLLEQLR